MKCVVQHFLIVYIFYSFMIPCKDFSVKMSFKYTGYTIAMYFTGYF